jgi:hypothetical protein
MTPTIVFADTETTRLGPDRRIWELGAIIRRPDTPDDEREWFVHADDLDLANADRKSLDVGGFYQRHPHGRELAGAVAPGRGDHYLSGTSFHSSTPRERTVLGAFIALTHDAHIVGSNPAFDDEGLRLRVRAHAFPHGWYYKSQCVQTFIRGYLAGRGQAMPLDCPSDELFRAVGIEPNDYPRHTALGDARMARDTWDRIHA